MNAWGARCHKLVRKFRSELTPAEVEDFNTCLLGLSRNPQLDEVTKFQLTGYYLYRDDQFVLLYSWQPVASDDGGWGYLVTVYGAARTSEFEQDNMVVWKWWTQSNQGHIM